MYGTGFQQVGPAVSSVSSATQAEGTSLVHTVTLASAVSGTPGKYAFNLTAGTASTPSDYTATPTFSNSVTLSGGVLTVPIAVTTFTITVATTDDAVHEGSEAYSVTVGNVTNTGTITDNESAPTVTGVSSASATEASSIVHTVTVTGTAQAAQTYAISLSGGTATGGGTDYTSTLTNGAFSAGVTISGGNISVPSGVTSFTVTVPTTADVLEEGNETYTLTIGGASGTGTIVDDDAPSPAFTATLTALTNATGTVTTLSYINPGSGSTLTLSVDESTVSGVAPLAVFFDATGSTSTETTRPFHDVGYWWDFGDTGAGTWSNGTANITSKNIASGPMAAHVFETAGTYTVELTGHDGVSTTTTTKTITVTAADTQWAGTKTICFSTGTDFTGAPSGCTQVPSVTNLVTAISSNIGSGDCRLLLKRGDTFNVSTSVVIDKAGPGYVGAFGSGAKPIIKSTAAGMTAVKVSSAATTTLSNWRFVDVVVDGDNLTGNNYGIVGSGGASNILFLRTEVQNVNTGIKFAIEELNALNASSYTTPIWSKLFAVDCTIYNLVGTGATGGNGMYLSGQQMAVLGTSIDLNMNGEHALRQAYGDKAVYCNNTMRNVSTGRAYLTLRAPSQENQYTFNGMGMSTPRYTQQIYVADNHLIGSSAGSGFGGTGPTNAQSTGRAREQIWERNLLEGGSGSGYFGFHGSQLSIRNNIALMPAGSTPYFATVATYDGAALGLPNPTDLWVYNNTIYYAGTGTPYMLLYAGEPADGTEVTVLNNLVYDPSGGAPTTNGMVSGKAPTMTVNYTPTNCNTNGSEFQTSPNFTTTPPTTAAHVKPTTGSYAIGRGTAVPVWSDYMGVAVTGTQDIGAVHH